MIVGKGGKREGDLVSEEAPKLLGYGSISFDAEYLGHSLVIRHSLGKRWNFKRYFTHRHWVKSFSYK